MGAVAIKGRESGLGDRGLVHPIPPGPPDVQLCTIELYYVHHPHPVLWSRSVFGRLWEFFSPAPAQAPAPAPAPATASIKSRLSTIKKKIVQHTMFLTKYLLEIIHFLLSISFLISI